MVLVLKTKDYCYAWSLILCMFEPALNSFGVMRSYIACTCVGAHLLGITRVGDTAYCVWLIVFNSNCCVGSSAPMVVHVLDCRRGFEHLTGCKWRHARYIRCKRCCLQCVIHALSISHAKRSGQHHIVSARDGRRRATRRSPRRSRSPHRSRSSLLSGTLERGGTLGLRVVSWHFSQPSPTERCACPSHYCAFARE